MSVVILVPDVDDVDYGEAWRPSFDVYRGALRRHGHEAVACKWPEYQPEPGDFVLPLLAWGYHRDPARWQALVDDVVSVATIANPADLLRWNLDKRYLGVLASAGVPVVPTRFVDVGDLDARLAAQTAFGTDRLVMKPRISAGSANTLCLQGTEGPLAFADALLQPFLPAVLSEGETSLIYLSGRISHGVVKRPRSGDFRVQAQFGGIYEGIKPSAAMREIANQALAFVPSEPLYARIDLVRGVASEWLVIEVELIEPDLYLSFGAGAPDRFGSAVAAFIERAR